jgi:hypothetical protein
VSRSQINDAQPAHGHADIARKIEARVIGSPMNDLAVHFLENAAFNCLVAIEAENATDSTHG